jgi:hypothetical protein
MKQGTSNLAANRHAIRKPGMTARHDRPLIGIVLVEEGEVIVRYVTDESEADAAMAHLTPGRSLAGLWADLDWEDAIEALDRIRHESVPTPLIETL